MRRLALLKSVFFITRSRRGAWHVRAAAVFFLALATVTSQSHAGPSVGISISDVLAPGRRRGHDQFCIHCGALGPQHEVRPGEICDRGRHREDGGRRLRCDQRPTDLSEGHHESADHGQGERRRPERTTRNVLCGAERREKGGRHQSRGVGTILNDDAPSVPAPWNPANDATDVTTTPTLTWTSTGATSYDVLLGTSNPPPTVTSNIMVSSYVAPTLRSATTYYWQIIARNSSGSTPGPIWSFVTAVLYPGLGPDLLVRSSNLAYQGAFRVPGLLGSSAGPYAGLEWGGTALGFNPANDSLFIVGHDWYQFTAEITVETPINGPLSLLNTARALQR